MSKNAKRGKGDRPFEDFRVLGVVDAFPERLAEILRLLFHLDKQTWDFCLDRLRQHRADSEGKPAYKMWSKSKGRNKGRRYFAAPCEELKTVQRSVLDQWLATIPVHFARHGNHKGTSSFTAVYHHACDDFANAVFSVDLCNAFPSVFRSRIKTVLIPPLRFALDQFGGKEQFSDEDFKLMLEAICDLLAYRDRIPDMRPRMPQGPPTSPRLFDICCYQMDKAIYSYLQSCSTIVQSYRYTGYVDNLVISSNQEIPAEVRNQILTIIRDHGFVPHSRPDKCVYFSPQTGKLPVFLGLVITADHRITMTPNKANQLRGRLHRYSKMPLWDDQIWGEINGVLGYIRSIYPDKLPSSIRAATEKVEARVAAEKLAQAETKAGVDKPSEDKTAKPKKSRQKKATKTKAKKTKKNGPDDSVVEEVTLHVVNE